MIKSWYCCYSRPWMILHDWVMPSFPELEWECEEVIDAYMEQIMATIWKLADEPTPGYVEVKRIVKIKETS